MNVSRLTALACLLVSACGVWAQTGDAPASVTAKPDAPAASTAKTVLPAAYEADPKFAAAMKDAKELEQHRQYAFALDGYKKANKIAGGSCMQCLKKIYGLQYGMGNYRDAAGTAAQRETLAADARERSFASTERGSALLAQGGEKPKPAQLDAAHAAFQQALTENPKNNAALYHDACVLARMGKTEDAAKAFATCADKAPANDPMRVRARHFAEKPSLALAKMAPAFEVTALDGTKFNLNNMGGKVVLIDFWATWCGPCNEELPHMKKIAREFANDPLVILSISWDKDEVKWKEFITKNEMTWLQYRDADHSLTNRFGINAIPHYFTIDSDGVLTAEMLGEGSDVEGKLKKLIKRAREAESTRTVTNAETSDLATR